MDLVSFTSQLAALVGRPTSQRPFVCDRSPLDCRVFIVGLNPATSMSGDWWEFWDEQRGYRRAEWFRRYVEERARQPLRPGKTRRAPISNTRRVIDWITGAAAPVKVLETNIYSTPSVSADTLAPEDRRTEVFDFLLQTVRPRVVLAHGNDAIEHLRARGGLVESADATQPDAIRLHCVTHFSRGWSEKAATELGQSLKRWALAKP